MEARTRGIASLALARFAFVSYTDIYVGLTRVRQFWLVPSVAGVDRDCYWGVDLLRGRLAQLGERCIHIAEVTGSRPVSPTNSPLPVNVRSLR